MEPMRIRELPAIPSARFVSYIFNQKEDKEMKLVKTIIVLCAFSATAAYAVDPQLSDITCAQLGEKYELTAEGEARFAELKGSCEGVYEVNGALYVRSKAVIRGISGKRVRIFLPATNNTFEVTSDSSQRIHVGNRKLRVRDLSRGDEIGIYISVDKFAQEKVDEIAFATEDSSVEEIVVAPVEEVEALPTTG